VRSAIAEKIVFRIFDRWGELIFETTDISKGWDGSFRGKKVDPDVYDYYLEATCIQGDQKIIKGNITLMK
jgi:gliding motility-associated-like protein